MHRFGSDQQGKRRLWCGGRVSGPEMEESMCVVIVVVVVVVVWGIFRVVVIAAARAARRSCVKLPEALSLAAWLRLSIGPRSPALAARAGLVNAATTKDSRPSESPQRQASPAALGKDVFLAAPLPACVATPAPRPTPPVFLHTPASDSPRPHLRHVAGGRKARMGRCPRAPDVS